MLKTRNKTGFIHECISKEKLTDKERTNKQKKKQKKKTVMIQSRKFKIRFTCLMCDQTMVTDETESQNQLRVVNREFFFMHTIKTSRREQTITIIISVDSIGTHSAWQQGMMNNPQTNTCFEFTAWSFKYFDCMRKIDKICH